MSPIGPIRPIQPFAAVGNLRVRQLYPEHSFPLGVQLAHRLSAASKSINESFPLGVPLAQKLSAASKSINESFPLGVLLAHRLSAARNLPLQWDRWDLWDEWDRGIGARRISVGFGSVHTFPLVVPLAQKLSAASKPINESFPLGVPLAHRLSAE